MWLLIALSMCYTYSGFVVTGKSLNNVALVVTLEAELVKT